LQWLWLAEMWDPPTMSVKNNINCPE